MDILDMAYEFAKKAHEGQKDRSGNDYITHPVWVANHLMDTNLKVVAYLHDVVEDSDITLDEIENNFGLDIRNSIDSLTKRKDEDYLGYIERLMKDPIAKEVKIMDIRHNMDLSRINQKPTEADFWRIENKYKPAYRMLCGHNLLLSEQIDSNLCDLEIRHLLFNILSKRLKFERIDSNIEYILNDYSNAISDSLKDYIEGVLHD